MIVKQTATALLQKMPDDATWCDIVRWVKVLDLIGMSNEIDSEFEGDLDKDLKNYFAKRAERSRNPVDQPRKKALEMIRKLPADISVREILNRVVLLKKIAAALEESDREEGMDHDEFFAQLLKDHEEESRTEVVASRTRRSARDKKTHRQERAPNGRKVRPAS